MFKLFKTKTSETKESPVVPKDAEASPVIGSDKVNEIEGELSAGSLPDPSEAVRAQQEYENRHQSVMKLGEVTINTELAKPAKELVAAGQQSQEQPSDSVT